MKKIVLILIGTLISGMTAWAYGPYCGPVVRGSYYSRPAVVYAAPVVYSAPVVYASPPVVYQAPVVYAQPAPVVYAQPAYYAPPAVQVVTSVPLFSFWFGGHRCGHRW